MLNNMKAPEVDHIGSLYVRKNIANFEHNIHKLICAIENSKIEFDSIAFCGISGALYAPTVAYILGKELILVRKSSEICHSSCVVEGFVHSKKYIIIDDLVAYGSTIRRIQERINMYIPLAKCQAVFAYAGEGSLCFDLRNINIDLPLYNL